MLSSGRRDWSINRPIYSIGVVIDALHLNKLQKYRDRRSDTDIIDRVELTVHDTVKLSLHSNAVK